MISQWKTLQTAPKQLAKYVWKKGQSGNPAGRPPGKTLKEFAREYLMSLANDEKVDYLASLPADVIDHTQNLSGRDIERAYVDKGYRGHDAQNPRRVFISGQKRSVFGAIKREQRRRSAIEPVIGHLKAEGHLGRGYLKGRARGAANAIHSAVGNNFRRILAWLKVLLRQFLIAFLRLFSRSTLSPAC